MAVSSGARAMLLTQIQAADGNARPEESGREGALLVMHDDGTQGVGSVITTRALAERAQANKAEKRWRRGMARERHEVRWHLT